MKAKKDVRKPEAISIYSDQDGKSKKGSLKPVKNERKALYEELEDEEDLDLMDFRKKESILDYLDDEDGGEDYEEDDEFFDEEEDFEYEEELEEELE